MNEGGEKGVKGKGEKTSRPPLITRRERTPGNRMSGKLDNNLHSVVREFAANFERGRDFAWNTMIRRQ